MDSFIDNLAMIANRWPKVAQQLQDTSFDLRQIELISDGDISLVFQQIQVASSFNQYEEAKLQISALPTSTPQVTLYGTGLGLVQQILLENTKLKSLNVVIFNLALFKVSLTYFGYQKWLIDPRVTIDIPSETCQVESPFIALPAELALATNQSAHLRDRVCLSLDHDFIEQSKGIRNIQIQTDIMNNLDFILKDHDINELFSSQGKTDYIVCGAGPTLAEHFNWLNQAKHRKKFTLIAVDAAVMPLSLAGITPDIIVSIDPDATRLLDCIDTDIIENVPLVYFPIVTSALLTLWQAPKYTAYSTGELYNSINELQPKGRLYCAGSVIHPSIDLAVKMGARKVILLGTDFSFPDKKSHTYWQHEAEFNPNEENKDAVLLTSEKTMHWVLNGNNERVPTLLNYRGYLRDLEDYISLAKHVDFFNGSRKGALIRGTQQWSNL